MSDDVEIVHVVHGRSIAETLRDALRSQGCEERVIGLSGDLNYGPIDPPDPDVRQAWIRTVLRCDPADDRREPEAPWTDATSAAVYPVFWVCMSNAGEQASFLEFAYRMAGRPFDVVDATGLDHITLDGIRSPRSLGSMRKQDIVASDLRAKRRTFSGPERDAASAGWSRLRRENAPLRVVRDGRLVSAPLTHFDAVLVGQAEEEWEVFARLIGRAIRHLTFDVDPPDQGVGDVVLFGRVRALGDMGALEVRGAGPGIRDHEVRRPAGHGLA
jgi:hypothetical protein